jgi:hypothetical protein
MVKKNFLNRVSIPHSDDFFTQFLVLRQKVPMLTLAHFFHDTGYEVDVFCAD